MSEKTDTELSVLEDLSAQLEELTKQADALKAQIEEQDAKNEMPFAEQVDKVLTGEFPFYSALKVCDTPQILLDVGCRQLPMLYTQRHLKKAVMPLDDKEHQHGLKISQIKAIPQLIESPVMVFDSPVRNDSIVVVTSAMDSINNPILVSIKPNGSGKYELEEVDSNFITSIYGRNNFSKLFERIVSQDLLLFCDMEKSQEMFERWGEQYSELTNKLGFDTIIHQSRNIVNPISEKISENFSEKDTENIITDQMMNALEKLQVELEKATHELQMSKIELARLRNTPQGELARAADKFKSERDILRGKIDELNEIFRELPEAAKAVREKRTELRERKANERGQDRGQPNPPRPPKRGR